MLAVLLLGSFRRDLIGDRLWSNGFQQSWDVYAPEPIRRTQTFEAVISYTDGTKRIWRIPRAGALFPYSTHRWERWADGITLANSARWWQRAAQAIARDHSDRVHVASNVVFRRRWRIVAPPGAHGQRPPWNQVDFYALDLR